MTENTQVIDANGNPIELTDDLATIPREVLVQFFAGRVPAADCPHYIAASEARAGFKKCEHC